jgi:hypothetical protein
MRGSSDRRSRVSLEQAAQIGGVGKTNRYQSGSERPFFSSVSMATYPRWSSGLCLVRLVSRCDWKSRPGRRRRLPDEYDAAQENGVLRHDRATHCFQSGSSRPIGKQSASRKSALAANETRAERDSEAINPGIVRRALDRQLAEGKEPTKSCIRRSSALAPLTTIATRTRVRQVRWRNLRTQLTAAASSCVALMTAQSGNRARARGLSGICKRQLDQQPLQIFNFSSTREFGVLS